MCGTSKGEHSRRQCDEDEDEQKDSPGFLLHRLGYVLLLSN